jgi:putative toxin-antitoxin system antitoxin component (TIGR02293 family)
VIMKRKPVRNIEKRAPVLMVKEKEIPYYNDESFTAVASDDTQHLISKSRNGISMERIEQIMERYHLTLKETSNILNISERTLQRYHDSDILTKDTTERALRLQRLYERGSIVFGTLNNFMSWMKSPVLIFNNEKPISFLDTIFGFEMLEDELGKIEHGIFA